MQEQRGGEQNLEQQVVVGLQLVVLLAVVVPGLVAFVVAVVVMSVTVRGCGANASDDSWRAVWDGGYGWDGMTHPVESS